MVIETALDRLDDTKFWEVTCGSPLKRLSSQPFGLGAGMDPKIRDRPVRILPLFLVLDFGSAVVTGEIVNTELLAPS